MTTVLSGERPIVRPTPTEYSFRRRPSNCSVSFGILPSSCGSGPTVQEAAPPATCHLHHHHGDVVCAAVVVGGGDQKVADPLRLLKLVKCPGHRVFRHHARQAVAAQQHVVAWL